jgi:hypothetical protein
MSRLRGMDEGGGAMKVIDATRDRSRPLWRAWRRRLHGAIARTLTSSAPVETWRASLPALANAAETAMRANLEYEFHSRGREMMPRSEYEGIREQRAELEPVIASVMGPKRIAAILDRAGVDIERTARLLELVGTSVADALAFLEVMDVVMLDDGSARGAA